MDVPEDLLKALNAISLKNRQIYWDRMTPRIAEDWAAIPANLARDLMGISIRGRVAFATVCLEAYVKAHHQGQPLLAAVLSKLWEFVESNHLGQWDFEIGELAGGIMDSIGADDADIGSKWGPWPEVTAEVASVPLEARVLICKVIKIGRSELYGGIPGYSLGTLWPTLVVVKKMLEAGVPIPDILPFRKSSFDQFDGWGKAVPKAFFSRPTETKE